MTTQKEDIPTQTRRFRTNLKASSDLIREDEFEGRKCIVAPCVALEEGVLEYPQGAGADTSKTTKEFVSREEIRNSIPHWEAQPYTVSHPRKNGRNLNARSKEVLESQAIGWFFNAYEENGKLKGEIWIEKEKAKQSEQAQKILDKIENGQQVPVSTAYLPDSVEENGTFNGKEYDYLQTDLKPNHIAGLIYEEPRSEGAAVPRLNSEAKIVINQTTIHDPDFSGTSTDSWSQPDLEDFTGESWDDLSNSEKRDIGMHFIGSDSGFPAENFSDMFGPVVEVNGDLNLNALRNLKSRSGQISGLTSDEVGRIDTKVTNLANNNFEQANFTENAEMEEKQIELNEETMARQVMNWLQGFVTNQESLGEWIAEQREEMEMTQKDLADELPIAVSTVGQIERGEIETPSQPVIEAFAEAFDVDVSTVEGQLPDGAEPMEEIAENSKHNTARWINKLIVEKMNASRTRSDIIEMLSAQGERSQEWWRNLLDGTMMERVTPEDLEPIKTVLTEDFGEEIKQSQIIKHLEKDGQKFSGHEEMNENSTSNESITNSEESDMDEDQRVDDQDEMQEEEESPEQNTGAEAGADYQGDGMTKDDKIEELEKEVDTLRTKFQETKEAREEMQQAHNSRRKKLIDDIVSNSSWEEEELEDWETDKLQKQKETVMQNSYTGQGVAGTQNSQPEAEEQGPPTPPSIIMKDDSDGGDK